jgi:hypothetical protein
MHDGKQSSVRDTDCFHATRHMLRGRAIVRGKGRPFWTMRLFDINNARHGAKFHPDKRLRQDGRRLRNTSMTTW